MRGDSHYCSEPALALLEAHALRLHHRLRHQLEAAGDRGALARAVRHAPLEDEADGAPLPSAALSGPASGAGRASSSPASRRRTWARDARFIVTNLEGRGKTLYEKVFCARGAAENLIKDMKRFTRSDKTACSRWQANQFRLFLHMGAYWLLHSLRRAAPKRSRWRGATFETIRRTFVKIAVRVEELKGRIKLAFPASYPHAAMLAAMTGAINDARPMTDAAGAARAPPLNRQRVPSAPNPQPSTRPRHRVPRHAARLTNKMG